MRRAIFCIASIVLHGCTSPKAFLDAGFHYESGMRCALLAIPEQEVAIIPIREFNEVFPESKGSESMAEIMGETVLAQLATRSNCFQDQKRVVASGDLSAKNYRKFEEHIGSSHIRANVLDRSLGESVDSDVSLVVILNNITFEYVGNHTFVPQSDFSRGVGTNYYSRELSIRFDYALQNVVTLDVVGYGSVYKSKAGAFVSKERRWLGLIEASAEQLLEQLEMSGRQTARAKAP